MQSFSKAALGLAIVFTIAACDSPDDPIPGALNPLEPRASVRFFHAVPDAPDVNITVGGTVAAVELEFGEATSFSNLAVGTNAVTVDANVPGGTATVIGPADIAFDITNDYTIVAAGEVDAAGTPIAPIIVANPESAVGAGNVRVEVVHAAPNAPAVDIFVTAPGANLIGEMPIAGGATPFGANSGQIEVLAGDYQIRVTAPGSTMPLFDSGTIALAAGSDLMVVAMDNTGPGSAPITLAVSGGITSFQILDVDTPAEVRVVHAVPDLNGVDVYVNDAMAMGMPAIPGLDFPGVVPAPVPADSDTFIEFAPGDLNVLVTVAGQPGIIGIPATDIPLEAGQQYTIFASNTLGAGIEAYITEDDTRAIATEARTRIIHLAPSAGLVDIYVTAPMADITNLDPTFEDIDFGDETGYVRLPGDDYDVTVTLADTKTAAIGPATISLEAGGVYTAVARDPDGFAPITTNPNGFGLILLDDF